jgi:putative PIN family toxin of toxin-antitoxin system
VPLVVLDTSVLVAAFRSRRGAAFRLLSRVSAGDFDIAVSVPLVLEYEDALLRQLADTSLSESDVDDVLDYLCSVAKRPEIFFLWRPLLRDPKDDLVAEVAVAAGCDAIVTYNRRDFAGVEQFGIRVRTPAELLRETGGLL